MSTEEIQAALELLTRTVTANTTCLKTLLQSLILLTNRVEDAEAALRSLILFSKKIESMEEAIMELKRATA